MLWNIIKHNSVCWHMFVMEIGCMSLHDTLPFLDFSIDAIVKPHQTAQWDPEEAIVVSLSRNILTCRCAPGSITLIYA